MVLLTRDALEALMREKAYLHPDEIEPLCRYAALDHNRALVEIGTAFGASAALMLLNAPDKATITSIDPFVTDSMGTWRSSPERAYDAVVRVLSAHNRGAAVARWSLLTGYSYDVVQDWRLPIDVLFLDGDHAYVAVRKDFDDWLPFVKGGGLILLHDSCQPEGTPAAVFDQGWAGPTRLANELRDDPRVELIDEVYSLTVWQVKEQNPVDHTGGDDPQPRPVRRKRAE